MIEHPGASCGLSLLIVVAAALILYRPDPPPTVEIPTPPEVIAEDADGSAPPDPGPDAPAETPRAGRDQPRQLDPARAATPTNAPKPEPLPNPERASTSTPEARDPVRDSAVESGRQPTGPFTTVEPGERLEDVAARVYGGADAVGHLRAANRDLLGPEPAGPSPGMLLRTPPRPGAP